MASIIVFDEGATPQRVLSFIPRAEITNWASLPDGIPMRSDVLVNPDISAVHGVPYKYWKYEGGSIVRLIPAEIAAYEASLAKS